MVKIKDIITAVFVVIIGALAVVFFFQSEESKVKKQFNFLSKRVSKEPDEKKLAMVVKQNNYRQYLPKTADLEPTFIQFQGIILPKKYPVLRLLPFHNIQEYL